MAYVELTPLQGNSLSAKTTSLLADDGVSVDVDNQAIFYRGGSLLTKGWVLGPDDATESYTEVITVSATDDVTGAGTVTISARGVKADGTNGAAREWPIGTTIKNTYTIDVHDQIRDNFIEHATLITARATKTTAVMSVYVDSAATGAADGTSWTDAFTTIQAAINSLPVVLEHAVTIYVRKGASAYGDVAIQNICGKGSLTVTGEYYWRGQCTAAVTPSQTHFQLTASDASYIEVGDFIFITHSGVMGLISTVKTSTLVSGTTYDIEINTPTLATSPENTMWGNLGTGDYYNISKTTVGGITVTNTSPIYITGLYGDGSALTFYGTSLAKCSCIHQYTVFVQSPSYCEMSSWCCISAINCGAAYNQGATLRTQNPDIGYSCVLICTGTGLKSCLRFNTGSFGWVYYCIMHSAGIGVYADQGNCTVLLVANAFTTGTYTGVFVNTNGIVYYHAGNVNNASIPKNPATSTANPYIGV